MLSAGLLSTRRRAINCFPRPCSRSISNPSPYLSPLSVIATSQPSSLIPRSYHVTFHQPRTIQISRISFGMDRLSDCDLPHSFDCDPPPFSPSPFPSQHLLLWREGGPLIDDFLRNPTKSHFHAGPKSNNRCGSCWQKDPSAAFFGLVVRGMAFVWSKVFFGQSRLHFTLLCFCSNGRGVILCLLHSKRKIAMICTAGCRAEGWFEDAMS